MQSAKNLSPLLLLILTVGLALAAFSYFPGRAAADAAVGFSQSLAEISQAATLLSVQDAAPAESDAIHPSQPTIKLKSRHFQPASPDRMALTGVASPDRYRVHILVQLDFIPRQTARDELAARGLVLLAYVPDLAWIAAVPAANPTTVLDLPGVTWAGPLLVEDKLDPAIVAGEWGQHNLAPDGTAAVFVVIHQDESLDTGIALVEKHAGEVVGRVQGINMLVVELPQTNVYALAAEDAVQWIEPAAPPLGEANDGIRTQIEVDTVQNVPYSLTGNNIDILIYDSGTVTPTHADFSGRLTIGDAASVADHSTHVAGTAAGSGSLSASAGGAALQWRGMAPGADVISYGYQWNGVGMLFYDNPGDIEADWAAAQNSYGADVGNASLSSNIYRNYTTLCDRMGNYGTTSVLIDQIVRGGNSVVGVGDKYIATWAAGNERGSPSSCGTYSTTSPPAAAKNPIHVGASNTDNDSMTTFSSWGPTDDGRVKPTIVAGGDEGNNTARIRSTIPEMFTNSSTRNCDGSGDDYCYPYDTMRGTSMAAPAVAGSIALMLEHYRDVFNTTSNFWPSTAKVILVQTAQDLGNPGPDYQWGYGQVDIQAAVDLISRRALIQESVAHDAVDTYYFVVPTSTLPTTVSLAWDDYEATVNADPSLINDLDLELVSPSGQIWSPWILDPDSPNSNATRGVDGANNQEQVQVPAPEIGTWLVRVRGTTVPQGPQDYSLACEGCRRLNLGVCQNKVSGTMLASSLSELQASALSAEIEELVLFSPRSPSLSAGELWQRSLEADVKESDSGPVEQDVWKALETAQQMGPEAIVALKETLTGSARDVAMGEIVKAMGQLVESAPAPLDTAAMSEAEEQIVLETQQAVEAQSRARALTGVDDPAEGRVGEAEPTSARAPTMPTGPAADRTVGNDCTYSTIAAAIAEAGPGDRLLIEGGRAFIENVTVNISLTLQGGYDGCASASTDRTTVNGSASGPVIIVDPGLDVTLENLNVINGASSEEGGGIQFALGGSGTLRLSNLDIHSNRAGWGAGIWVGQNADLVAANVAIHDNTATEYGGGVRLYGGRATFSDSDVFDNSAPLGGGVYATLASGFVPALNLASSADVYDNQALTGSGLGGGIYVRQGSVSLTDNSDLYSNDAIDGGGAYLVTSTLTIASSGSEIDSNTATGNGGGVYAQGSTVNLDDDAELLGNSAGTDGSGSGGGAYLDASALYSRKASIHFNAAQNFGGGVHSINGSTVDMDLGSFTCIGVRCSQLYSNASTNLYGGGIYANNSTVYLDNIFVESNSALYGGGVYVYDGTLYTNNSLFARNNATAGIGDALRLFSGSEGLGAGNTVAYNDARGASTGRAVDLLDSGLTLDCSIIWGHSSSINVAGQNVAYSDVQGGYTGTGNINMDPQFVNASVWDYHLRGTSPAIDRCLSGSDTDFDNGPRPIVRTTGASPYDMGADEVAGMALAGVNGPCSYPTIQQAINAAAESDTVRVASGVYFENLNIANGKVVTITGGYDSACTTPDVGTTRVDGSAQPASTVAIGGSVVNLRDMAIAWGSGAFGGGLNVVGGSQVMLDNVDAFQNHGVFGGGMYVSIDSSVVITNDSDLYNNTASDVDGGGGARVWGKLSGYGASSSTFGNCAPNGGGFYVPGGELYLDDADVYANKAAGAAGRGGGIMVTQGGVVTLTHSVSVGSTLLDAQEAYDGVGIYADNSALFLEDAAFGWNAATHHGGALYLTNDSQLYATGVRIGYVVRLGQFTLYLGNSAQIGAGLYVADSSVDFGGDIAYNLAVDYGAGLFATSSVVNLSDARVGGRGISEGNRLGSNGHTGAGLFLDGNTHAILSNTLVISNTFQTAGFTYGGGAYVTGGSVLTLTNSRVEGHLAPSASNGRGAGIYVNDSTVTLDNSQIVSNTAGTEGGGLRLRGASTLNVYNGSSVSYNESINGGGGGIAAAGAADITILDSTLQSNVAGATGGAVFLNAGALDAGRSTLHRNSATRGGAIFQGGTAVSQISNSLFYTNTTTAGYGGGVRAEDGVITMTHVTFADNVNGAGYSQSGGSGAAHDSIAWANDNGGFWIAGGTFTSTCNIDQTGAEGINIDPQFVAPGAGEDYHLSYGSPAVDACPAGLPTDLDHVSRPIGDGYDMGAYEYAYAVALAPDNVGTGEPSSVVTYTHALTNTGGRTDTYALTAQSSEAWVVLLDPASNVTLNDGQSVPVVVSLFIPAGVLSGTLDTTVVTATSLAEPNVTAQAINTTQVAIPRREIFLPLVVKNP